ncbi:hypothetical protein ACH4SP_14935 [Streptomyces sp. NPDC021093]|uniref:hypothetical protein n=1 Tax=Streptomyces sp. NPDC021093 TaxID=3365112 RepID=UPI00378C5893
MSAAGSNQDVSKPAMIAVALVIALGVGLTVFDGALRTTVTVALGVAIIVCAGFVGAAVKRGKQ